MIVWRLLKSKYVDICLNGRGAREFGGRWDHKGTAVAYTAQSQSLAILETLVHLDKDLLPNDFFFVPVELPNKIKIERLQLKDLPKNWQTIPAPTKLQDYGTKWIDEQRSLVLEVPSVVLPSEKNYLINPQHKDFKKLSIGKVEPCFFDKRLF